MSELMTGLYVTVIGVSIVFVVLGVLAVAVYLLKYVNPRLAVEKKAAEKKEGTKAKPEMKQIIMPKTDPETTAVITAAIALFQEWKKNMIRKAPLFSMHPGLARLLPLAGIYYEGDLDVSVGGSDRRVHVRETGLGSYIVEVNGRKYSVVVKK